MNIRETLTNITRDLAGAAKSALAAALTMENHIREVREQISAKHRELDAARGEKIPRRELVERFRAMVDERAARFGRVPPAGQTWPNAAAMFRDLGDWRNPNATVEVRNMSELLDLLCFVAGDALKAGAPRLLSIEVWTDGLPASERPEAITRLEREVAQLEAAEEEAITLAAQANVVIARRPEVAARLQQEADASARQERWTAGQRERQAVIDQRPEGATSRSSVSAYIEKGRM